jgi:arsenate reductase (glutaredoxin)
MKEDVLVLSYAGCGTCKKALKWLAENGVAHKVRPIVEQPPTRAELDVWIPASGLPLKKWLNTSGQSYRAIGKAKIDAASDREIIALLAADGKLVKRPVVLAGDRVLVGFSEEAYSAALRARGA